jgi:hypothetical protein
MTSRSLGFGPLGQKFQFLLPLAPADEAALASLLASLQPQLFGGLNPPDASQLQLALQSIGGDNLGPPLLDGLLKSGGGPPGDLPQQDLQQQLALVLAGAPAAAAASIVGDGGGAVGDPSGGLTGHVGDPHVHGHAGASAHGEAHHAKPEAGLGAAPGLHVGADGHPSEAGPQM